jgi:hypothetical protein
MKGWILVAGALASVSAACGRNASPISPTLGQSAESISGNTNCVDKAKVDAQSGPESQTASRCDQPLPPAPSPAAPVIFADTFNRADGDLGDSWDSGYTGEEALKIVRDKVRVTNDWSTAAETVNAIDLPNDQWAQFKLAHFSSGAGAVACVILRAGGPGPATWYEFSVGNLGYSSRIVYRVNGVNVASVIENGTNWADGDMLRAEAIGTTLNLYRNGALLATMTDANLASGRAGIRLLGPNTPEVEISDFSTGGL